MKWILRPDNIANAIDRVTQNKGAPGIDKMTYAEVEGYFAKHGKEIWEQVRIGTYTPTPVRRVYIPKPNGKKRPLGIPVVVDRVVQQAIAQVLSLGYEQYFSNNSFGYRPGTGAQHAVDVACTYLDEGFEWVVDLDIEKFFDTVNHDKLIAILRERVNEDNVIKLIRAFLKAGVMEEGLYSATEEGVPQGGRCLQSFHWFTSTSWIRNWKDVDFITVDTQTMCVSSLEADKLPIESSNRYRTGLRRSCI